VKTVLLASIAVFCLAAGAAAGYFIPYSPWQDRGYMPSVFIKGDVSRVLELEEEILKQYGNKSDGNGNTGLISLKEMISMAGPASSHFSVYIIASDGRTAELQGDQLQDSYIGFGSQNGWEAINPGHPVSSNIKDIREIIVALEERHDDFGLNIINMEENITFITPGNAYLSAARDLGSGGTSFKGSGDEKLEASAFQEKYIVGLEELTSLHPETIMLMGARGEYVFLEYDSSMFFEVDGNRFSYNGAYGEDSIDDLKGVVLDPTASSIMDVYHDTLGFTGNDSSVLLIITDGMGYHQYEYAVEKGHAPFLGSISKASMALSVYQPVTNAGLAAMLTGRPPSENGIYSRKQRIPEVPTIMGEMLEQERAALLIEGDIQVIKTELEASLHSDRDSDGTIDDEIFEAAMENLEEGADFMAVHFHSIDDSGHGSGDLSPETMERIKIIDSYISQLVWGWQGKVIITSDHGMHSTSGGGDHGQFRYEDMVVPYMIIDGGKG
jgi:hypothetical protein